MNSPGKTVEAPFDDVVTRARAALEAEGFGIQCDIDIAATLKSKIGAEIPEMRILGACQPHLANRAIRLAPQIGVFLPCNVVVRRQEDGRVRIEAIDAALMGEMFDVDGLDEVAGEVAALLQKVIDAV
jgi:uncharacterized protein (DUF302 family)